MRIVHLAFWDHAALRQLLEHAGLSTILIREKPFAWEEEVGRIKWMYLLISLLRSIVFDQRSMHLFGMAKKL